MKNIVFILILIIFIPSCINDNSFSSKNSIRRKRSELDTNIPYKLKVDEVHYIFGVKTIVNQLYSITGIDRVEFIAPDKVEYNNGYTLFYWNNKKNNIPFNEIKDLLSYKYFNIDSIEGQFIGKLIKIGERLEFVLKDSEDKFDVHLKCGRDKELFIRWKNLIKERNIVLVGEIWLDRKEGRYKISS